MLKYFIANKNPMHFWCGLIVSMQYTKFKNNGTNKTHSNASHKRILLNWKKLKVDYD